MLRFTWIFSWPYRNHVRKTKRIIVGLQKLQAARKSLEMSLSLASGKNTKNYGQSQFLMGKPTINGHFQ